ncbi:MAG: serine/threonine-protein kinase [Myxococcota bacterium]
MVSAEACPTDETFARFGDGGASPAEREALLIHADACPRCHKMLAGVLGPDDSATEPDLRIPRRSLVPQPGDVIAHYVVKELVGQGGMGVVLRAHDTKLGRDVALKLIASMRDAENERRLVREAQAMAQLSHPNVVAVHDVDRFEGGVYFAMELVEGDTMRQWQAETRPDWRALLLAWIGAGAGLAAAHAAGIVHRDFKPANVLIGRDGRARVTDFGLAGVVDAAATPTDSGGELAVSLTRTGTIMGTPRYMSPEQMAGDAADHRSDQFSFAVSLHHAAYGEFPFRGTTLDELRHDMLRGELRTPGASECPGALWPVVRRALQVRPDDRYADMEALLHELRALCEVPRRRRVAAGVGLIGLAGLAGGLALGGDRAPKPCQDFDAQIAEVWSDARADAVRTTMLSSGLAHAPEVFERTRVGLDDYAARWAGVASEVCEATHVSGAQSEALLDVRMRCLDDRARAVASVVEVLSSNAGAGVVNRAIQVVAGLEPLPECATEQPRSDLLDEGTPEQQAQIDLAEATTDLGQYAESLEIVTALLEQDTNEVVRSRALIISAANLTGLGRRDDVISMLKEAGLLAAQVHADRMVAGVHIRLAQALYHNGQIRESNGVLEAARFAIRRVGDTPRLVSYFSKFLAVVYYDEQKYEAALGEVERARAAAAEIGDTLMLAQLDTNVGGTLAALNRNAEAVEAVNRGLTSIETMLGSGHPDFVRALRDATETFINAGRYEEALVYAERRLAHIEPQEATKPELLATALNELAIAELELSHLDAVVEHAGRSLAIYTRLDAQRPVGAAQSHKLLAHARSLQGKHEEAEAHITAALAIQEAEYGKDAGLNAIAWHIYGEVLRKAGRYSEAIPKFERMIELVPNEKRFLAYGKSGIGACMLQLRSPGALEVLEAAMKLHENHGSDAADVAEAQFDVARARALAGDPSALALAQKAEAALREPRSAELHREVVAWIAAKGAEPG